MGMRESPAELEASGRIIGSMNLIAGPTAPERGKAEIEKSYCAESES